MNEADRKFIRSQKSKTLLRHIRGKRTKQESLEVICMTDSDQAISLVPLEHDEFHRGLRMELEKLVIHGGIETSPGAGAGTKNLMQILLQNPGKFRAQNGGAGCSAKDHNDVKRDSLEFAVDDMTFHETVVQRRKKLLPCGA